MTSAELGWVRAYGLWVEPAMTDHFLSFFIFFFLSSLALGANSVPRHFLAPHQHGYSAKSFLVYFASMIKP